METIHYTKQDMIEYLRLTLIPDLLKSGQVCTAMDFETTCQFMEGAVFVNIPADPDKDGETFCNAWRG